MGMHLKKKKKKKKKKGGCVCVSFTLKKGQVGKDINWIQNIIKHLSNTAIDSGLLLRSQFCERQMSRVQKEDKILVQWIEDHRYSVS